jgi:uncharacterized integral membrane protein
MISGARSGDHEVLGFGIFGAILNTILFLLLLTDHITVQSICCFWQMFWPLFLISLGFISKLNEGEKIAFLINAVIATLGSLIILYSIQTEP